MVTDALSCNGCTVNELGSNSATSELTAHEFSSADLESAIWSAAARIAFALTYEEKRAASAELSRLYRQRRPEMIEQLERQMRLRP